MTKGVPSSSKISLQRGTLIIPWWLSQQIVSVKKELVVTHVEESKLSRVFISDSDFDESDFHIQSPGEFLGHSSNCAMS